MQKSVAKRQAIKKMLEKVMDGGGIKSILKSM